ncbi:acyl-CoA dehydrogenase family protein [Streptomyces palmae]|uniref:Acyl-CoA dehydrogenase n=1 Tax=Streptomyces palmae TaxID=1701085 RepID=A0A4Z0GTY6_9ACTN|nr:acyl-CoA dehydrogenase family protein [Streptomyces palmae]TGA99728.1 acyl-CoA dehydrogenase [Streptomyces palmae]
MDLELSRGDAEFRDEAREWLAARVPREPLPSLETQAGFAAHREWERTLAADRWSVVAWPPEYGGRGASLLRWLLFEEEYYAAGAPGRVSQNGIGLLAPALMEFGTAEQCARLLPPMARGEVVWAQAWSEPEAGSDLAALRSTATRTTGGWLLHGQKTWSSRAAFADRAFGLFRLRSPKQPSGAGAAPHRGLVYLMFPLDAPEVTVRPLGRLDGKPAFAELFLDGVFVPDADVIGVPGEGWRVAMSTTGNERGLTLRSPGRFTATATRLAALWRARAADGDGPGCGPRWDGAADGALRDRVADAVIRARAYRLYGYAAASRAAGGTPGAAASLTKVFWSELDIALHEAALDLLGACGELADEAAEAPAHGGWAAGHTFALAGPIYAGTNEIQRDIIAERLLGLPKGRRT